MLSFPSLCVSPSLSVYDCLSLSPCLCVPLSPFSPPSLSMRHAALCNSKFFVNLKQEVESWRLKNNSASVNYRCCLQFNSIFCRVCASFQCWLFVVLFLALQVLPTIVYFSATISVLYYVGVIQVTFRAIASVMHVTMATGAMETFHATLNIFCGWVSLVLIPTLIYG